MTEVAEGQSPKRYESESPLWSPEISSGIYSYPLPVTPDMTEIGTQIAAIDPPEESIEQIGPFIVSHSPPSHYGAHSQALDFLVPDGTPVLAADDGEIVDLVIDNTEWGATSDFATKANYIVIKHANGEFTRYTHLASYSFSEQIQQQIAEGKPVYVARGQQIATTGKTGWTDRDHLHFTVFIEEKERVIDGASYPNSYGFRTLKPQLE